MHKTIIPKVLLSGLLSFGILFANAREHMGLRVIWDSSTQTVSIKGMQHLKGST